MITNDLLFKKSPKAQIRSQSRVIVPKFLRNGLVALYDPYRSTYGRNVLASSDVQTTQWAAAESSKVTTGLPTVPLNELTGGIDTQPREGDVVIVGFATGGAQNYDSRNLVVAGFTEINELYSNDTYDANLVLAYKVMTSTPATSVTITGGTLSTSAAGAVAVHVWRNVNISTQLDVSAVTNTGIDTAKPSFNSITPVTDGAVVICCGSSGHTAGTCTFTSGDLSNFITSGYNDKYDATIGMGSILMPVAGPFTASQFGFSGSDSTSFAWASIAIALRPMPQGFGIFTLNTINQ